MTRKEDINPNNVIQTKTEGLQSVATKTSNQVAQVKQKNVRSQQRKVKWQEPLAEQRLYDTTVAPKDGAGAKSVDRAKTRAGSALSALGPPLSLVAHLDLAAKKLNARPAIKSVEDNMSIKTMKTVKSSKSLFGLKESKGNGKKGKS